MSCSLTKWSGTRHGGTQRENRKKFKRTEGVEPERENEGTKIISEATERGIDKVVHIIHVRKT